MKELELIQTYFDTQSLDSGLDTFLIDVVLTAVASIVLSLIYIKFGSSLSDRKSFSKNFVLLSLTTMMVISIIKSSLALSLGLVGSLSIIRFRSAIKEPEELAYLFLSISLGIGFGAGQRFITLLFFFIIAIVMIAKSSIYMLLDKGIHSNLYLNVSTSDDKRMDVKAVVDLLKKHFTQVRVKRIDETGNGTDFLVQVHATSINALNNAKKDLVDLDKNVELSFYDNSGIFE